MTSHLAYVFPGQGAQYVGMGRDLVENFPAARAIFAEADEALGLSLGKLCFEGPADALQLTENTQPAILATSIAALGALRSEGIETPAYVAGHSLGEYTALVAAGAITLAQALRLVKARGRYMQEAVPYGEGAMAAILGLSADEVRSVCAAAVLDGEVCSPANFNSPGQVVIAGNTASIDRAIELLKEKGAKRAIKLNVSAPFHCALMLGAQERLAQDLEGLSFEDLRTPLITNVDATAVREGRAAKQALIKQVSSPVRWEQTIEKLTGEHGVTTFIEIGPGKVLSGLIRQTNKEALCYNVEDAASARKTLARE